MRSQVLQDTDKLGILIMGALVLSAFAFFAPVVHASTINVSGNITTSTTWSSGNVYVIQGGLTISSGATLTVASGTVVKLDSASTYLIIQGTLQVNGDASSPVYFTSLKDDAAGGDTNGDGSATSPGTGNWGDIEVDSGGNATIDNAIIRYGGGFVYPYNYTDIYVSGGNFILSNSHLATSSSYGLVTSGGTVSITSSTIENNGAYGVYATGAGSLTITSSTFSGNGSGVGYLDLNSGINFTPSGNTASGASAGFVVNGSLATSTTWYKDIPYIVSGITVPSGKTLTVNHGTIVKFQSSSISLNVQGTLDVQGASGDKVYFTSIKDDSVGGDTNNDGVSSPGSGDWNDIEIDSGASTTIDNAVIAFGSGSAYPFAICDIYITGGNTTISNSQVATSSYGITVAGGTVSITSSTINGHGTYGLYESGSSGALTVAGNTFFGNGTYDGYVDVGNGVGFSPSGNTAFGSGKHGFAMYGTFGATSTWTKDSLPYIITTSGITIPTNKTLTINHGAVVKFDGAGATLQVDGLLQVNGISTDKVYFTSIKDDTVAGDSNGDGNSSSPAADDWNNIGLDSGASTTFNYAVVRYGGANSSPFSRADVYITGGNHTFNNSDVSYADHYGIRISGGTTVVTNAKIHNNVDGIDVDGGTMTVSSSSLYNNSGYGAFQGSGPTSTMTNNYWGGWIPTDLSKNSGPYSAINTNGAGNQVSNFIDYSSYIDAYLYDPEDISLSPPAVNLNTLELRTGGMTAYSSAVTGAITTWNGQTSGAVDLIDASSSASSTWNLEFSDINRSDLFFAGEWYQSTSSLPGIYLNSYYMGTYSSTSQQFVVTHELGHSLGLAHSVTGNIMVPVVPSPAYINLGSQDIHDYEFLWGSGQYYWEN